LYGKNESEMNKMIGGDMEELKKQVIEGVSKIDEEDY